MTGVGDLYWCRRCSVIVTRPSFAAGDQPDDCGDPDCVRQPGPLTRAATTLAATARAITRLITRRNETVESVPNAGPTLPGPSQPATERLWTPSPATTGRRAG